MSRRLAWASASCVALALAVIPGVSATSTRVAPLRVTTGYSTQFLYFGDSVTARVTVLADLAQVRPSTLRLSESFGSWTQTGPVQMRSGLDGSTYVRTWSYRLACLEAQCLGAHEQVVTRLPAVTLTVTRIDGVPFRLQRGWPKLSISPRFGPSPPGGVPVFEIDHRAPALEFRVDPRWTAVGLDVGAGLFAAFGLAVIGRELLRRRSPTTVEIQPLARALAFVRQAQSRPVEDRRRAVGLLARTLARDRGLLSAAASRVAWSAGEPSPSRLDEIVQMVEAEGGGER
jgi:hypothetical protein